MRTAAALICVGLAAVACSPTVDRSRPQTSSSAAPSDVSAASPTADPPPTSAPRDPVAPADFDTRTAMRTVRHLAGDIGPREATGRGYAQAARWVGRRLERLGYAVEHQPVAIPAGTSWGVPVGAGTSANVIARPPGLDPAQPHLVVGAHLDTVPQAPGAEDNASGVGVLVAVAGAAAAGRTRLPVVFVAFGAEEPRGPSDADHHYGSRHYVAALRPRERTGVRGMVSLDRVGVGEVVPIGSAVEGQDVLAARVAAAGRRVRVPVVREVNRSSDHWQFVQAGLPGVRLGSTPYAAYHSADDVPSVVDPRQVDRVGRVVLAWLAP
ncbi:M28 family metallopeptidase [Nocardioides piscis]|uniref:M28 family peptidase n=1 Tax=Nocardioides piscis TaxID=2714938 RepID=A0A6G7YHM8_9ACTN|nr:M28 family peptidase [Nocardioides piscis]QIK76312.1 M28 family peptidase [Nocardioides piscis]